MKRAQPLFFSKQCLSAFDIRLSPAFYRRASTYSAVNTSASKDTYRTPPTPVSSQRKSSALARVSTPALIRNILLAASFSSPLIYKPFFAILRKITNARSGIWNPDSNPVLRALLKPLLYDQFCAGTDQKEILHTRNQIKRTGYGGIILCYGKEIQISKSNTLDSLGEGDEEIRIWRDGNLETLDMVDSGDWLGIKLTGAGKFVTKIMMENGEAPKGFVQAMDAICEKAASKDCRIWIDAEQQVLQKSIDRWTIDLMRKYNRDGRGLVYNTIQAYLKASKDKLRSQLALADKEGWTPAIKLVRGAYIDNDPRHLIHDTKAETDDSYNDIMRSLLTGTELGFDEGKAPKVQLFLAGHNPESVTRAWNLVQSLNEKNKLHTIPDFGQLQGMGDLLGCQFLHQGEQLQNSGNPNVIVPKMYKCLTWGTIQECMHYLFRRAVENSGSVERMKDGFSAYVRELFRRMRFVK